MAKFLFKKEDLEFELEDETRYFADPEKDVCLYIMKQYVA